MKIDRPTPDQQPQLARLWQLAFGDSDAFLDGFFATGFAGDRCRCVTVGGHVAAALYWFDGTCENQKIAYLYAVATHPDYRHRGLCRILLADTHRLLKQTGYAAALLVPGDEGLRRMYGQFGYKNIGGRREFSCRAATEPGPIRKIGWEEYARLRRTFLPAGGVLQEGPCLSYLATFANAYAGPDFLLVAAPRGPALHGMELLGRESAAPGILRALGFDSGTFAVPGETPFAMYLPLTHNAPTPAYFGLDLA